jgi:hypothetical protein
MENLEQELRNLDDLSSFFSLMGSILAIKSNYLGRITNKVPEKILTIAVFFAACGEFINLAAAKKEYDNLKANKTTTPLNLSAVEDLLTSRIFSTIGSIYLIKATLKSSNSGLFIT